VQEIQSVQEAVPLQTAQAIQQTQRQVETVTRPVQEDVQPAPEVTQTVTRTETAVEKTKTVEQQNVAVEPVVAAAMTPLPAAVTPMLSPVTERRGVEESQAPVETPQQVEQTVTARTIPEVQKRAAVQHLWVRSRPTTRPDYGWLSQALWSTVEQRKRYPPEARRNRWEGKVILKLTIEQRGAAIHLLDVSLEESSGHSALDRHTLDMVRNAFPLNVTHSLAQQHVQLHLPFSYRME
jgi:TonB family protein